MRQADSISPLIRLADFAKAISVSTRELYRMIDAKEVPAPVKQGRRSFFFRDDLESYFDQLRKQRK